MPAGGLVCQKCRSGICREGDRWCQLCSCGSTLSELARVRFHFPSHRSLAEEVGYQAVRQIQALVDLDKHTNSQVVSLSDRLANSQRRLSEAGELSTAAPKSAGRRPGQESSRAPEREGEPRRDTEEEVKCEEPDYGEESSEESSEEVAEERTERSPVAEEKPGGERASGHDRPPEPPNPPGRRSAREDRRRSRSRDRGRRGGARHQANYRALQDPNFVQRAQWGEKPKKRKRKGQGPRQYK